MNYQTRTNQTEESQKYAIKKKLIREKLVDSSQKILKLIGIVIL
jgi:hypothetical protein